MFPMVTKLSLIERDMFQVTLNPFLHFLEKSRHSFKTLNSKKVGRKHAKVAPKEAALRWRPTGQIWVHFCSKIHGIFSMFPMVTKILLFTRGVFEIPSNIFMQFFATSGLSCKTFNWKWSAKIRKTGPKAGWSQMRTILKDFR